MNYPFSAPSMTFLTPIYHPNVDEDGKICLESLKLPPSGAWKPSLNLPQLLLQIKLLVEGKPNVEDPLNLEASNMYKSHHVEFVKKAKEWTRIYAQGEVDNQAEKVEVSNRQGKRQETIQENHNREKTTTSRGENQMENTQASKKRARII